MRKKYTFGILFLVFELLNSFSSFSQNPVANNDSYDSYANCNSNIFNFLENDVSLNGIDPNSIDLAPFTPGIQTQNGLFSTSGGMLLFNPLSVVQESVTYTFKDNLGNISNIATVQVNVFQTLIVSPTMQPTCSSPLGGVIFCTSADSTIYKLYKNGILQSEISNYYATFSGLSAGDYFIESASSCGVFQNVYISLNMQNPFTGSSTASYIDFNNNGVVDVGDVMNFQFTITNNSTCILDNVTLTNSNLIFNTSQPIPSLEANMSNSTYSALVPITQNNINSGSVTIWNQVQSTTLDTVFNLNFSSPLSTSNGVKLNPFIDTNNNGIQNSYEADFTTGTYSYQVNSGAIHYINSSLPELYLYETNPASSYNLGYSLNTNANFCDSQNSLTTSQYNNVNVPTGSGITTYNFPIVTVPCNDVSVYLYGELPRPGFEYTNTVKFTNEGNQTISGTITFNKNVTATLVNTSPTTTLTSMGFTYNFSNLNPRESRYIQVRMLVPTIPTVQLGQFLTNSVTITPSDANMPNNSASLTQPIVGSFDPNDKTESHGGKILHSSFTANDYLNYTIRFENTGTANAINIKVEDVLDSKLDETSIRMIASSHPYVLDRVGSNLKWNFNGVNLPPSSPASATIGHGYIVFQVKPKPGFAIGDVIPNTANIYFDFNPAIVTNTCTTEFVSTLSNENFTFNNFKSFPNPVKNALTVSNASPIETIEISSILGQKMIAEKVNDIQTEIDLSQLSNGIYFVKVTSQGNEKTIKIIKE